jgi:hypothetical protein
MASFFDMTVGQEQELRRVLASGGFDDEFVKDLIKNPHLAQSMLEAAQAQLRSEWFDHHDKYLLDLEDQLELIKDLNDQIDDPASRIPWEWLGKVADTSLSTPQHVYDLETFFVIDTRSQDRTFRLNEALFRASGVELDRKFDLLGFNPRGMAYPTSGIHRVRLNLVNNWKPQPKRGISAADARLRYLPSDDVNVPVLAGMEVVTAYALQPGLLPRQSVKNNLPGCVLAGMEFGPFHLDVPHFAWNEKDEKVNFNIIPESTNYDLATPTVERVAL